MRTSRHLVNSGDEVRRFRFFCLFIEMINRFSLLTFVPCVANIICNKIKYKKNEQQQTKRTKRFSSFGHNSAHIHTSTGIDGWTPTATHSCFVNINSSRAEVCLCVFYTQNKTSCWAISASNILMERQRQQLNFFLNTKNAQSLWQRKASAKITKNSNQQEE